MVSDLMELVIESSAEGPGLPADPMMLFARTIIVPKNSGIQNVLPDVMRAWNRAKLLRPPYRYYAMEKAKELLYGIASISSEGGHMIKEMNTTRQAMHMVGQNQGQKAGPWDSLLYGDKYLKNNPKGNDDFMTF